MASILSKQRLSSQIVRMELEAPAIANHAAPGQFVIIRVCEEGERIPLTLADWNTDKGSVTVIFAEVGLTTKLLGKLEAGQSISDIVGPLGKPTEIPQGVKRAVVVGGGLGCAIAWPQAKALSKAGAEVDIIAGFKTAELVILEKELSEAGHLILCTDDGSAGRAGFVSAALEELLKAGTYDLAIAIGPLPMMRAICNLTKPYSLHTIVSMNPIMIDGTGMCGGCRLTVGGKVKFACVDGPDFNGHQVDFEEAMARLSTYRDCEKCKMEAMFQ